MRTTTGETRNGIQWTPWIQLEDKHQQTDAGQYGIFRSKIWKDRFEDQQKQNQHHENTQ